MVAGAVWCGVVWCGVCVVWCGVVWCGVVWCTTYREPTNISKTPNRGVTVVRGTASRVRISWLDVRRHQNSGMSVEY